MSSLVRWCRGGVGCRFALQLVGGYSWCNPLSPLRRHLGALASRDNVRAQVEDCFVMSCW